MTEVQLKKALIKLLLKDNQLTRLIKSDEDSMGLTVETGDSGIEWVSFGLDLQMRKEELEGIIKSIDNKSEVKIGGKKYFKATGESKRDSK